MESSEHMAFPYARHLSSAFDSLEADVRSSAVQREDTLQRLLSESESRYHKLYETERVHG